MEPDFEQIKAQARTVAAELLDAAGLRPGDLFVVGCSSSEVLGGHIGKASSREAASAVFQGIYPILKERGVYLAAQCCEHLNRALVVEAECAARYGYEPVCVVPQPKAGGSVATQAWWTFSLSQPDTPDRSPLDTGPHTSISCSMFFSIWAP